MMGQVSAVEPVVVVVENDIAVLTSLKFTLELEGFRAETYPDSESLLRRESAEAIGCLVLDYFLPDMNALDLLARLRAAGVTAPALLITTNPGPALRRSAAAAAIPIIEKPLLSNLLIDTIRSRLTGDSA